MLCMHTFLSHVARHTLHLARAKYQIGVPTSQLARANFHLDARELIGWRAPSDKLARAEFGSGARQVQFWRTKQLVGARQVQFWRLVWFCQKRCCVAGFDVVLVVALLSLCALFNACSL